MILVASAFAMVAYAIMQVLVLCMRVETDFLECSLPAYKFDRRAKMSYLYAETFTLLVIWTLFLGAPTVQNFGFVGADLFCRLQRRSDHSVDTMGHRSRLQHQTAHCAVQRIPRSHLVRLDPLRDPLLPSRHRRWHRNRHEREFDRRRWPGAKDPESDYVGTSRVEKIGEGTSRRSRRYRLVSLYHFMCLL